MFDGSDMAPWLFRFPFFFVIICVLIVQSATSQGTRDQYDDAASYQSRTGNRVFGLKVVPQWIGNAKTKFWYRISTGQKTHAYRLVDCVEGKRSEAFDHMKLASDLSKELGKSIDPHSLDLGGLRFADEADEISFDHSGQRWIFGVESRELRRVVAAESGDDWDRLPAAKTIPRSGGSDVRVSIRFVNQLEQSLEYFWVKSDGSLQSYGVVGPKERAELSTFDGHAWLIKSKSGQSVAAFVASEDRSLAVIDNTTPRPQVIPADRPRRNGNRSPDGKWQVRFDGQSLTVLDEEGSERLTTKWREVIAGIEGSGCEPGGIWWSPDSMHFVMMPAPAIERREIAIVESSPRGTVHPRLQRLRYVKPGDSLPKPNPLLFSLRNQWEPILIDDSLFPNPYSITRVQWASDSHSFSFLYNQRGHQSLKLIDVDAVSAEPSVCIDETSETFVCYSQKTFLHHLESTGELIWMSERSGWNHLYLIDSTTGEVKNAITKGDWVVRSVEEVDESNRQLLLTVSGINPDEDPYHQHLIRVDFDGGNLVRLTEGDGDHRWRFSPDGKWLIDHYSRVDLAPVTELRSALTGKWVCELERADVSRLLETGWQYPERFVALGRDGVTKIHGMIIRPMNFDPNKKYPVLEHIYAGPHSAFVPKQFGTHRHLYEMAELGFIVVKIDGMGTSHRSKAFHDVCWQNLGDSGFPDRILWMQSAAKGRPEMDLDRVGIWGGSAGGQSAMRALIAHGDFYDAASADCGCHDNRVDKIWWNEQWMGWPIGDHYEQQSNVAQAHRLKGDLLLIWGELDRNVDPASSMQVVDALIRADKDFTQLIVPGAGHGAASHPYAKRRQADFFVRSLWGTEPRAE